MESFYQEALEALRTPCQLMPNLATAAEQASHAWNRPNHKKRAAKFGRPEFTEFFPAISTRQDFSLHRLELWR
jgi:hypothetical protein